MMGTGGALCHCAPGAWEVAELLGGTVLRPRALGQRRAEQVACGLLSLVWFGCVPGVAMIPSSLSFSFK